MESNAAKPGNWSKAAWIAALAALGLLVRAWLIQSFPMIYGSDSITRLLHRDRILLAHQLPAWPATIFWVSKISMDPALIRYWTAMVGAGAGAGFYLLARDLMDCQSAWLAALFFIANPFLLSYSIVPYQEMLMLAGLLFAFHFFFAKNYAAASLFLAMACFTRYEAWAACPVLAAAYFLERNRKPAELARAGLLFGWAPAAWILYARGIAPSGTLVVEASASPARLMRYVYVGWVTAKNTSIPVLLLALMGLWGTEKAGPVEKRRLLTLGAFYAIFLLALFFSAHGNERDWERFVSAREAHIPIAGAALLAGLGLAALPQTRGQVLRLPLAVAGITLGLWGAYRFVARETADPEVALSYRVAQYLDRSLEEHETALILAKPVSRQGFEEALERAYQHGGEAGRRAAQRVLDTVDATPTAHQRIVVQSRLGRDRLLAAALGDQLPGWIVVWSDFQPVSAQEIRAYELAKASGPPVNSFRAGSLGVEIYHLPLQPGR